MHYSSSLEYITYETIQFMSLFNDNFNYIITFIGIFVMSKYTLLNEIGT